MGVGHDDSRASHEEARARFVQPFQVNDGRLGLAHKFFERKLGLKAGAAVGHFGRDFAREGFGNRLQVHVKMIGLEEPVFSAIPPVERNPVHGTFGELDFLAGVTDETNARHDRMLEARTHGCSCLAKIAAGKISFERRDAGRHAIEFHRGAGRRARNLQPVGERVRWTAKEKQDRAKSDL